VVEAVVAEDAVGVVAEDVAGAVAEDVVVVEVEGILTRRMMIETGRDNGLRPVLRTGPASAGLFLCRDSAANRHRLGLGLGLAASQARHGDGTAYRHLLEFAPHITNVISAGNASTSAKRTNVTASSMTFLPWAEKSRRLMQAV
jgi:hypothetical protein